MAGAKTGGEGFPGGYGQQALMHDEEVLGLPASTLGAKAPIFGLHRSSAVRCSGCARGKTSDTPWSVRHLMPHYGAVFAEARVGVDGNFISAAGVTAGLDAALVLVSLLRGDAAAQEIQLPIEYAPNLIFDSRTPGSASAQVLENFQNKYEPIGTAREKEAMRYAAIQHAAQ
jgi:cyclohexyl-isocyanide hydratase